MEPTRTLINAQISFIEGSLRLIHIPRDCYDQHVKSVLQLTFPAARSDEELLHGWSARWPFLNISFNSVECSIFCSSSLAEEHFGEHVHQSANNDGARPSVSVEEFVVIAVEGEGMEASQRVLDLTTPLAMASIPIFFITTYFCDYILVPLGARSQVVHALEERGFVFETVPGGIETHINVAAHHRNRSSTSGSGSGSVDSGPMTPPPASVSELQGRTFNQLGKHGIKPQVLSEIRLVQCAGRRTPAYNIAPSAPSPHELALQLGLMKCIIYPPSFLSATLTANEPPAFLLEESLRRAFFSSGHTSPDQAAAAPSESDVLIGGATSPLVPIMLNLAALPIEATGIVCGVAGKLAQDTNDGIGSIEMSYLSTTRTGTVLVEERDLKEAVRALDAAETGVDVV